MAIEITKAGIPPTEQLVGLLGVKAEHLREAALRGIQIASENNDANCQVLLKAGIFTALQSYFEDYPQDRLENASKILIRLVPFLRSSREACGGLLQLLGSKSSNVRDAARNALLAISNTSIGTREILRAVILDRLEFPSNSLIEYAVKAIQDWLGPDLAHLNDFPNFFGLIEHANERIQNSALIALTQKLSNADYHESLEKANIMSLLRSLSDSNNSKAVDFVKVALPALSLSLARNGHASDIIDLIAHNQLKVREGAATALETICRGPVLERKHLVEKNIIENLVARGDHLDKTEIHLLASIIPILVCDYLEAGKIDLIFPLVDHPQEQIRTATSKSIAVLAHGAIDLRTSLGKALLSQLEQGTPLLRQVAADCLSQSLAHDLVLGGDFAQVFSMFSSEDPNVRKPIIAQLRTYIQMSDETARGRLVEANILPAILQAYTPEKDDLLDFMTSYLLPMLGPSFTQNDGGVTLFPLLEHEESRLRTSAVQALKNAIDSRDANMEKMAKASIVLTLHPLTASNDIIRDLWCRILPKAAPYLENRAEIDVLFDSLNHDRGNVREAASEAITVLVKTSDASRSCMLPTLLYNLERQSPASVPSIARAISLSGFTFVSNGKEAELLFLIRDGKDVGIAAVEAIIQLLSKGGSYEHERLVRANPDILTSALKLHDDQSQRQRSLKLLRSIVMHLSYILFLDEESARALFSLFDDPDPGLSTALYQTWSNDSRVYESSIFSELIPLLFDGNRLRNPSVTALLRELADSVVPQLVKRRRLDTLVRALRVHDANVVRAYLEVTRYAIEDCHDNVKGWFVAEPLFIPAIGKYLKGRDAAMRRDCSSIIHSLSTGSASRSGRIMNEGIGNFLSWVAVKGEKGAQESSLEALCALFQAAPDHAERLVKESLPALCYVLGKEDLALVVHHKAFHLLLKIVQQSPHSPVVNSGIVAIVVRWLSPSYTVTDGQCKKVALDICRLIAENSDTGRNSLINAGILPELLLLTSSQTAYEVMGACMILKALVHTGTFSQHVIAAGLKTSMEHITSPIRKSTLKIKEDKQFVQAVAKDVLNLLKQSKQRDVKSLLQAQVPEGLLSQAHPLAVSLPHQEGPPNDEGFIPVDSERSRRTWRRSKSDSEPLGSIDSATLDPEMEEVRESVTGNARHSRSRGNPARPPPRSRRADLSTLPENPNMSDFSQDTPFEEDEDLEEREPSSPSSSQRTVHSIPSPISPPPLRRAATTTSRLQRSPNDGFLMDPSSIAPTHFRTTSLPYGPSAPGPRRRRNQDDDTPESLTLGSELDSNTAERGAASSQGSARRRSSYLPSFGSIRR